MDSQLIDMEELMEIMDSDTELIRDCFDDFVSDSPEMLQKIKAAIVQRDGNLLERTAHAIKGSLRYLAAGNAAEMAFTLEKMGKNMDFENAEDAFNKLEGECGKLKEFMADFEA